MIKSMTGFGKGRAGGRPGTIIVEIRSLNHKYFDLVNRLPNHLAIFEDKVREYVKKKIRRGRINISAAWEGREKTPGTFSLNMKLARKYYQQLARLKKQLRLKNDIGIRQIASLPEVLMYEQKKQKLDQFWPHLKKALDCALNKLNRMREAEGKRLSQDLHKRIKIIRRSLNNIEQQLPRVITRYKNNLLKKIKALSGTKKLDQDRIAEEVALFVRNIDVSEELTRLKSHIKGILTALRSQKEAGKELDFIAQEMFREANTVGAKSGDLKISRWVIKIKSQIEKIREQLQNVE